ncbi:histidine triad (HIT) family protein [Salisediminibacterium halotolerans]|uniref:Histidine triad (HIT) family protein n=1 Tax=Salisediminibacterium halotolerans TaxID=517425 RepID=A0A1H9TGP5_9BACI|nr:histidine triad (HIT) family protein [Salisediminibacterium haloalkalitolerans]
MTVENVYNCWIPKNKEVNELAQHSDCIFCKIVSGDIPGAKVYEDEHVLAFLDISQVTEGHTLVIPKNHQENIYDLTEDDASHVFQAVPKVARALKQSFNISGLNMLNNNGEFAGQSVFHFHVHLLPRYDESDGFAAKWHTHADDYSAEKLQDIAKTIEANIQA